MQHAVVQALFPQRRLIHVRQAATERQLLVIEQGIGDQPRGQALLGFRRVFGHGEAQALVDAAVDIGEVQLDLIGGGRQGHGRAS
ncbi:hypothetical protein D3C86_1823260 [compost metagenome]